ncbi:hypothetical protein ACFLTY_04065 [Chloroflexota bacterium]
MAKATIEGRGMANLPVVFIEHPVGELPPEEVRKKTDRIMEEVIASLGLGG